MPIPRFGQRFDGLFREKSEAGEFLASLKTKAEDYPALKEALRFLKFSPEDIQQYN